ncbi:Uncharacterised protein [Mycobacteroides abscessus subsp. abscessus]|nr:Uncharacterised protein [Mycobacteroides abscessus subsp. abscessus]
MPATASMITKKPNSSSESLPSPSTSALISVVTMSSPGFSAFCLAISIE